MALDDPNLDELITLIRDSFRVRENHNPIYLDVAGNLGRVRSPQFQVLFGRRGSGKSCLLVHYDQISKGTDTLTVYIGGDTVKRLQYPDLLVRLVLIVLESLPNSRPTGWQRFFRRPHPLNAQITGLRTLLDSAASARVQEQQGESWTSGAEVGVNQGPVSGALRDSRTGSRELTLDYRAEKVDSLERHLEDYRSLLRKYMEKGGVKRLDIIIDDFYLLKRAVQPDVVDYLHRLTRGLNAYLKVGTVRHRTQLARYEDGQLIGIELREDMEQIDLDRTFEDIGSTQDYLSSLLNSMGKQVGIAEATGTYLSEPGLFHLTLASGGVPRDYLNIFVDAVDQARRLGLTRVTPKAVYRAAASHSYKTKLSHLKGDAGSDAAALERVLVDLVSFCLQEKRKTAFLISQDEVLSFEREHDVIRQLVDFKLIHVLEPDTSAASGRPGRYEAYTLDFSLFMEPRRRGIELVEFWKTDTGRRKQGVREAPAYPLDRVTRALNLGTEAEPLDRVVSKATEGLAEMESDEGLDE